jgi:hypothetical protein
LLDSSSIRSIGDDILGDSDRQDKAAEASDVTVPAASAVRAPETAGKLLRPALHLDPQ